MRSSDTSNSSPSTGRESDKRPSELSSIPTIKKYAYYGLAGLVFFRVNRTDLIQRIIVLDLLLFCLLSRTTEKQSDKVIPTLMDDYSQSMVPFCS